MWLCFHETESRMNSARIAENPSLTCCIGFVKQPSGYFCGSQHQQSTAQSIKANHFIIQGAEKHILSKNWELEPLFQYISITSTKETTFLFRCYLVFCRFASQILNADVKYGLVACPGCTPTPRTVTAGYRQQ